MTEYKERLKPKEKLRRHIVGIGASAGSKKALTEILKYLPKDIDMAYIIVQHPDPRQDRISAEALSSLTQMTVCNAQDKMAVERNKIYVIPLDVRMSITNNILNVVPRAEAEGLDMPIDQFFTSLAEDQEAKTVGIILSGDTSDGAIGLKEISRRGGWAIVQDEETAEYAEMPKSAISTGVVNLILPPKDIAMELKGLRHLEDEE